jgi:hypothetical protein
MKALGSIVVVVLALAVTVARAEETPRPAVWSPHGLIVDLQNLPKRYTCDELWYKFKDVLLTIGARPDVKILPYRCSSRVGALAYSPKVQLEFFTPREVQGKSAQWADIEAVSKAVRLEPGSLGHFDAQDCELLSQMKSTLLRYLGDPISDFHLACQAPPLSKPPFGLTVEALVPVPQSSSHVVRVPPADQGGAAGSGS